MGQIDNISREEVAALQMASAKVKDPNPPKRLCEFADKFEVFKQIFIKNNRVKLIERLVREKYDMQYELAMLKFVGKHLNPDFAIDSNNGFAFEQLIKWVRGDSTMQAQNPNNAKIMQGDITKGLYLAGGTGAGKGLGAEAIRLYAKTYGFKYKCGSSVLPISWRSDSAVMICNDYSNTGNLDFYVKVPILCIEDIGTEDMPNVYMGNRINVIAKILEVRADMLDKITIVTTNLKFDSLKKYYGERVYSRLFQMFNYLEFLGPDRRIKL
jgi:hypothetical protein